jgi:hypothetical protein
MRYGLWFEAVGGRFVYATGANNVVSLKHIAREYGTRTYIYDHARNIKIWHRDLDGVEEYDDKTYRY